MASGFSHRHLLLVTCAGIAMSNAGTAFAQDESDASQASAEASGDSNVIIVTAQGREENLQDVPISILAISDEQLARSAIKELSDLNIPAVDMAYNLRMTVAVRGVSTGYNSSFDQSVPLFLDKVYFGRSVMSQIGLLDVERVEVLRGPQPVFFGKNAIAGAFSVITKRPDFDVEANVSLGYEFEANEQVYQGGVTVPASDTLAFRFAGSYREMDGWLKNNFLGGAGPNQDELNFRVGALWEPTPELSLYAKYENFSRNRHGDAYEAYNCGTLPAGYIDFANDDCELNGESSSANEPDLYPNIDRGSERGSYEEFRTDGGLVEASYDLSGGYNFTATLAHYRAETFAITERGGTQFTWSSTNPQEDYKVTSLDVRLSSPTDGRLTWLAGFFMDWEKAGLYYPALSWTCGDPRYATCANALVGRTLLLDSLTESDSLSGYAQVSYQILDPLTLVLAARYSRVHKEVPFQGLVDDRIRYDPATGGFIDPGFVATGFQFFDQERTDERFQPAVTLQYRPFDNAMFYVSYKEGFKAGGFDVEAFSLNPFGNTAFEPEYVKNYEAGMRMDFLDGRARVNLTGFRADYTNLQVASFNTIAGLGFFTQNAASQRSQGGEIEVTFLPVNGLELGFNAAYLDAKYREFPGGTCYLGQTAADGCIGGRQDMAGHRTVRAPEWSGNIFASFTTDVGNSLEFEAFANLFLTDEFLVDARDGPFGTQPGYERFDATISIKTVDDRWKLSLIGRNLNNARVYDGRNEVSATGGQMYNGILRRTRETMLQLSFRY